LNGNRQKTGTILVVVVDVIDCRHHLTLSIVYHLSIVAIEIDIPCGCYQLHENLKILLLLFDINQRWIDRERERERSNAMCNRNSSYTTIPNAERDQTTPTIDDGNDNDDGGDDNQVDIVTTKQRANNNNNNNNNNKRYK
jgi:hypothetical protein